MWGGIKGGDQGGGEDSPGSQQRLLIGPRVTRTHPVAVVKTRWANLALSLRLPFSLLSCSVAMKSLRKARQACCYNLCNFPTDERTDIPSHRNATAHKKRVHLATLFSLSPHLIACPYSPSYTTAPLSHSLSLKGNCARQKPC